MDRRKNIDETVGPGGYRIGDTFVASSVSIWHSATHDKLPTCFNLATIVDISFTDSPRAADSGEVVHG